MIAFLLHSAVTNFSLNSPLCACISALEICAVECKILYNNDKFRVISVQKFKLFGYISDDHSFCYNVIHSLPAIIYLLHVFERVFIRGGL